MPPPRVTIDELPEQGTPEDANLIVVQDSGVTKKMSIATLKTLESTQLTAHLADTEDVHDAAAISATPSGGIDGPTVQAQLGQLADVAETSTSELAAHLVDSDAHDASAISATPHAGVTGTDVQAQLEELASASALPEGGTAGQVLGKVTSDDFDVTWIDAATGMGVDGGNAASVYGGEEPDEPIIAAADAGLGLSIALSATAVKVMPFNPLQLGWAVAYYVEGPEFVALGLAGDAQVFTWPDEIGTINLTATSTAPWPHYRTAVTALNNQPAVDFSSSTRNYTSTTNTVTLAAGAHSLVAIIAPAVAGASSQMVSQFAGTANIEMWAPTTTAGQVQGGADGALLTSAGGVIGTAGCLLSNVCKGAGSFVQVNGTTVASGTATSTVAARVLTIGSASDCKLAFFALYQGDIHAHADWSAFKAWAATRYGITIA